MFVDEVRAGLARVFRKSFFAALFLGLAAPVAVAQDEGTQGAEDDAVEEVVVTGSRLKRDTFTSISPLQVISGQVSREIGSIDPSTILQEATAAGGQQIDITYQGFVLPNGPGASTIDLRGLGDARTLVLINGRRAAPVGVEGAPFAPDLNIIPASLVDRYEILTDGASSVYGSDAIAGVANIILRKDFEGFEFEVYSQFPEYTNGQVNTANAAWGFTGDRGFFGVAADWSKAEQVKRGDRPWSEECENPIEVDRDGNVYRVNNRYAREFWSAGTPMKQSNCFAGFGRRVFDNEVGLFGSLYYTPGESNVGIPNFSEADYFWAVLDMDGDTIPDVDFTDYFITGEESVSDLFPDRERVSVMSYGEYTFSGDMNVTPYFEFMYNARETFAVSDAAVLLDQDDINVPGTNPYNPCNPNGLDGVNCFEAWDNMITNPNFVNAWQNYYEDLCAAFGFGRDVCTPALFGIGPTGVNAPMSLEAQVSVRGDRDNVLTEIDQFRYVAGVKGDLPMIDFGSFDNWSFDFAVVHSDSTGTSVRNGILEAELRTSLETSTIDPNTGEVVCGSDNNGDGIPDGVDCVPVNMFAPSLYEGLINNDFATQAERDYLFAERKYDTEYKQSIAMLNFTGDLFEMPGGTAAGAFGFEYRRDEIDSIPNDVARDGLLVGFFRDLGAVGEKDTKEFYAEIEMPLFGGRPGMEELTLNVSTRYTDDEFYGGAWTYSSKLAYRPVDSLLIRATVGTSYRAPNLRENFLLGTSGFLGLADPCVPPQSAIVIEPGGGVVYDPSGDTRSQVVLDNCTRLGVNPETIGVNVNGQVFPVSSTEILRGVGTERLDEEKSRSWTAGFAWDQPFWSAFDLSLGATYYEVEIEDEIIQLAAQSIINSCYFDPQLASPQCDFIERNPGPEGRFSLVSQAFLNRDALKTRGVDLNMAIDWPTQVFGRALDVGLDMNFNRKLEFSDLFIDQDTGEITRDSELGEFGYPEWEGQGILRADMGSYRFTWSTRYFGNMSQDRDLREANDFGELFQYSCTELRNSLDPGAAADCDRRPLGEADNYFRHDVSVYYLGDTWTFGVGARNVTDQAPPQVDPRTAFTGFNIPFGAGYDLNGRSYFVNVAARFQ